MLAEWSARTGAPQPPFDLERDYLAHVDGKPRDDGVRDFLRARGIEAPEGAGRPRTSGPSTASATASRRSSSGRSPAAASRRSPARSRWVRQLRAAGVLTAVVVLERERAPTCCAPPAIDDLFELDRRRRTTSQRSACAASRRPTASSRPPAASASRPARAVVVEDALAGVAAGRAGAFGLVIGVARNAARRASCARRAPTSSSTTSGSWSHDRAPARAARRASATTPQRWQIVERGFDPSAQAARESVFAVGNGYLGVRGTPEEGGPAHDAGAILNGFHETWPIVYPEDAYGLARTGQTIVSATDGSIIRLFVDDEPFDLATARVLRFERVLDMRTGVLEPRGRVGDARAAAGCSCARAGSRRSRTATSPRSTTRSSRSTPPSRIAVSSELVTHAPAAQSGDDPRRGKGFAEKVLVPVAAHAAGTRAAPAARDAQQRARAGVRDGAPTSRRRRRSTVEASAAATAPSVRRARRARAPASRCGCEVRRLPLGAEAPAGDLARARRPHARPRARAPATTRSSATHARRVARLLAAQRRRARRRARPPAGGALQPLPAAAGDRARRGPRRARPRA